MISIEHELGILSREALGPEFPVRDTGFFKTPDPEVLGTGEGKPGQVVLGPKLIGLWPTGA